MDTVGRSQLDLTHVLLLELSICVLAAALSVANTLVSLETWTTKTQMNGLMGSTGASRVLAIEHFDQVGSFRSPPHSEVRTSSDKRVEGRRYLPPMPAQGFVSRDEGFAVTSENWLGRPVSVNFSPQGNGAEAYTVMWTCRSSNLPLEVVRPEDLPAGQDGLAA
jgi:hypothetical protein